MNIKMIIKSKSPTMRHVSKINRVALDWLFNRINLDQLADILTKRELCLRSSQPYCQTLLQAKLQWLKFGFRSAEGEIVKKRLRMWTKKRSDLTLIMSLSLIIYLLSHHIFLARLFAASPAIVGGRPKSTGSNLYR